MPDRLILVLAKEYGRPPQEIEQDWEPYWVNRTIKLLEVEAIQRGREEQKRKRARR
jgi:hypothetical protein